MCVTHKRASIASVPSLFFSAATMKKCFTIASLLLLVPAPSAAFQFLCANMLCTIKKWTPSEEGTFLLANIPNDTLMLKLSHLKANTFNLATLDKIMAIEIERSSVKKVVMPSATATVRLKLTRTYLNDIAFVAGNGQLNFLTITESRLKTIPSTIVHLVALETVTITKSPIETVNLCLFSKLTRLYELNLCSNKILFLHLPAASVGDFASLRLLFLSDNLLTTINLGAFNGMQALQTLDFQNNRIRRVQAALVSNSLQTLELPGNRLETLYCCEWHLPNLTRLALSRNLLSILPTCLSLTMPNVLYLILDRNALIDSDTWYNVFTLKRLQQLDISHNLAGEGSVGQHFGFVAVSRPAAQQHNSATCSGCAHGYENYCILQCDRHVRYQQSVTERYDARNDLQPNRLLVQSCTYADW
ncbi:platelet glycoprotein V-like [Anopheles merus]|uniref:platelet glycoprotein V-like n=1 Tax=Anopheles merus TaxID=30066 RepID=UPI001BE4BA75|nr:platelet glycoprotein V-like [Anopheles merus]